MTKKLREFIEEYPKLKNITDVDDLIKALSVETKMSLAQIIAQLPEEEQQIILADADMDSLLYDWKFWGRPGQIPPEDVPWSVFAMVAGRGAGKLLRLSTPVLTANGEWKTMGSLSVGDYIFDEEGNPTKVLETHPVTIPNKAYKLTFSDNTELYAGGEHQWVTWTHLERKSFSRTDSPRMAVLNDGTKGYPEGWPSWTRYDRWGNSKDSGPKVRTTQELFETLYQGSRNNLNHSIPTAKSLRFMNSEEDFKISPKLLGMWLGDGDSSNAAFTMHIDDLHILVETIEDNGFEYSVDKSNNRNHVLKVYVKGMRKYLRDLNLINNKHIPNKYLTASVYNRLELLKGLMDTDGYGGGERSQVEFCTVIPELASGVTALVRGLGEKPVGTWSASYLNGVRKKDKYRLCWRPKFVPFSLERKANQVSSMGSQAIRNYHRMITSIEPIDPEPMRCITVDSPHSLYLAGEALIPTHNTRSGAEWVQRYAIENPGCRIGLVGRTAADARDVMVNGDSGIINVGHPDQRPEYFPTRRLLKWANGSTAYTFSSEEPDQLRGPQFRLDVDTPMLTSDGWKTMGTLKEGDVVYDELGQPCNILKAHKIAFAEDAYTVTFSDKTTIVADGNHLWSVIDSSLDKSLDYREGNQSLPVDWARKQYPYRADVLPLSSRIDLYQSWVQGDSASQMKNLGISDRQIKRYRAKFREGYKPHPDEERLQPISTKDILHGIESGERYSIPATRPVMFDNPYTTDKLPLHPWVLGLSLGDGDTRTSKYIASNCDDISETMGLLSSFGYSPIEKNNTKIRVPDIPCVWKDRGSKYIPEEYFEADCESRLYLIRGLIDSDGHLNKLGEYEFSNTNKVLIDGFIRLCVSLGLIPKVYYKTASRYGVPSKPVWKVVVRSDISLGLLSRKSKTNSWGRRHKVRRIVSVEKTDPVMMRCITVDSPSRLYLAGSQLVPTHNTAAWADEAAAWKHNIDDSGLSTWDNLTIATRLGENPQIFVTTTPKRTKFMFDLIDREKDEEDSVIISRGSTMENAGNLSKTYLERIQSLYAGTRLAEQELMGLMLEEVEGALWTDSLINDHRVTEMPNAPLTIIAVDPSMAENPKDECGIIVASATNHRRLTDRHCYVIDDMSIQGSPTEWAEQVVKAWKKYKCPVVVEKNQGKALVDATIHAIDPDVPILEVWAYHGKAVRAEPVTLKYDQGRVHHLNYLPELESQLVSWVPGETRKSPDRLDALVYAITALLIKPPNKLGQRKMRAKSLATRRLPESRLGR